MPAAFDTISHRIVLDRLEEIGITDKALDLLKSYITNRTYRTLINDLQSDEFQLLEIMEFHKVLYTSTWTIIILNLFTSIIPINF